MNYIFASLDTTPNHIFWTISGIALLGAFVASFWKINTKAGEKGWASLVPVYNFWVLYKIAGIPSWLAILWVPTYLSNWPISMSYPQGNAFTYALLIWYFILLVTSIVFSVRLGKRFSKSALWSIVMLFFLPPFGYPVLGLGRAKYQYPTRVAAGMPKQPTPQPPVEPPQPPSYVSGQ